MKVDFLPLGQLISLVIDYRGKTPHKLGGEWSSSGYRALSALNVKTRRLIAEDKVRFVDEDLYKKWMKEEVQKGDILITSEAPFGQVLQWNSNEKIVLSQRLYALRVKPEYCSSYIYQYMASDFFYGELKARATGSTVEGLRQPALLKCKIAMPPLSVQRRIASILSAYDNLIENNTRRIRLLEQMAENIYKEWFVRFRFPGHENAEFENGLPKGWKIERYGIVTNISAGGDRPICFSEVKTNEYKIPIYSNGIDNFGLYGYTNEAKIKEECITISARGTVGYVCLRKEPFVPIVRLLSVIPQKGLDLYYLFHSSKSNDLEGNGTSQQQLTAPMLSKRKILIPSKQVMDGFGKIVRQFYDEINVLQQQSNLLARQRDLLLLRLMSGKLEVH